LFGHLRSIFDICYSAVGLKREVLLVKKVSEEKVQWKWQPRKDTVCESVKKEAKVSARDADEANEGKGYADFRYSSLLTAPETVRIIRERRDEV